MLFKDFPHKNTLVETRGRKYLRRSLSNRKILQKEYLVMKFLEKYSFSPKAYFLGRDHILEEYLENWQSLAQSGRLSDEKITLLAQTVRKLHKVRLNSSMVVLLKDEFTKDMKYHPFALFKEMLEFAEGKFREFCLEELTFFFENLERRINKEKFPLRLVHGDLSPQNIMFKDQRVKIVDWSDSRLDIFTSDLSQLFYLNRFSDKQEKKFLSVYQPDFWDEELFLGHGILLALYDIIPQSFSKISPEKKKLLLDLINKIEA